MALLRAVGNTGAVISYEVRQDFIEMAQRNISRFYGPAPNWTIKLRDAREGFEETGVDRLTCDLAEPWDLIPAAATALRPGGLMVGYVPTVLQVKQLVDALRSNGGFGAVQSFETLTRFWHVKNLSIRPEHRMVAHTGFIVTARRVQRLPKFVDSVEGL